MKKILLVLSILLGFSCALKADEYTASTSSGCVSNSVWSTEGASWNFALTGNQSFNWDTNATAKGLQMGSSNKACTKAVISTSDIKGTITSITVNASIASGGNAKLAVSVGGTEFTPESATLTTTATDYTFTGSASGEIALTYTASAKAFYLKSITVTYTTEGEGGEEPDPTPGEETAPENVVVMLGDIEAKDNETYTIAENTIVTVSSKGATSIEVASDDEKINGEHASESFTFTYTTPGKYNFVAKNEYGDKKFTVTLATAEVLPVTEVAFVADGAAAVSGMPNVTIANNASGNIVGETFTYPGVCSISHEKKNTNSSNVNSGQVRWYANDVMRITPVDGVVINKVIVNCSTSSYATVLASTDFKANGTVCTYDTPFSSEHTFAPTGQVRFSSIIISYSIAGESAPGEVVVMAGEEPLANEGEYELVKNTTVSVSSLGATSIEILSDDDSINGMHEGDSFTFDFTTSGAYFFTAKNDNGETEFAATLKVKKILPGLPVVTFNGVTAKNGEIYEVEIGTEVTATSANATTITYMSDSDIDAVDGDTYTFTVTEDSEWTFYGSNEDGDSEKMIVSFLAVEPEDLTWQVTDRAFGTAIFNFNDFDSLNPAEPFEAPATDGVDVSNNPFTSENISVSATAGKSTDARYWSDKTYRVYNGATLTISSTDGSAITNIEFKLNKNTGAFTCPEGTLTGYELWTAPEGKKLTSVTFNITENARFNSITVSTENVTVSAVAPVMLFNDNVLNAGESVELGDTDELVIKKAHDAVDLHYTHTHPAAAMRVAATDNWTLLEEGELRLTKSDLADCDSEEHTFAVKSVKEHNGVTYESAPVVFSINSNGVLTGINGVEAAAAEGEVEWFTLQGVRVAEPTEGLYIRRQGAKVEKVVL